MEQNASRKLLFAKVAKRLLAVSLAFCFLLTPNIEIPSAYAEETSYNDMSDEEKQAYLEKKLDEANSKLNALSAQSKETKSYLDALDEKISYLKSQVNIIKDKITTAENKIINLQKQYDKNQEEIGTITAEISALGTEIESLETQFDDSYQQYCQRLRAMYISGETSTISFLITSTDLSELMTRYEMVKRVSKYDTDLLQNIQTESQQVNAAKSQLSEKSTALAQKQTALTATQKELDATITSLGNDKAKVVEKEMSLGQEQDEANVLLKKLNDETQEYTEYRDSTQDDLDEVDAAIEEAAAKYTTKATTKKKTTTTKKTTTKKTTTKKGDTTATTTTATTVAEDTEFISLTFPIPSQTRITTAFHGYSGHSGCDFSCASGSTVVAAESGTVIVSADLKNSDGSYRSYGRYIVIAHDKTTATGNAVYTLYAHNSQRLVTAGTHVEKGQTIAKSGSTGNSTGPHCHFEVRTPSSKYADCVNPANYLP